MSGEVVVVTPAASAVESYVKAKRMRALAVLDAKRLTSMPDVPTSAEAGMPQLLIVNWYVLAAPAGTPRADGEARHDGTGEDLENGGTRDPLVCDCRGQRLATTTEDPAV